MSESDSFINEVTEEVRRERLFGYMRRYGWIGLVVVALLVGGAALNEYRKSAEARSAQALGDSMLDALETPDEAARAAAIAGVAVTGPAVAVSALLTAAEQERAGDTAAAVATLDALAINPDATQIYRDLATLKSLMLGADVMDPAERMAALEALAVPGAPYRLLAKEQIALAQVSAGDTDAAIATLNAISEDAEVSPGLRQRAQGLVVALGGEPLPQPDTDAAAAVPAQD